MTIRRFNYTGRIRIKRVDARVRVFDRPDGSLGFEAHLNLAKYDLPQDATVVLEAYRSTQLMRFSFGPVGMITSPDNCSLSEYETRDGIKFRLRIIDESDYRAPLLAEAGRIAILGQDGDARKGTSLLPARNSSDLGHEAWRLDFSGDRPELLINDQLGDFKDVLASECYRRFILHSVLRQVLERVIHVEDWSTDESTDDWPDQWVRFGTRLCGDDPPKHDPSIEDRDTWIDSVISAFCRRHRFMHDVAGAVEGFGHAD